MVRVGVKGDLWMKKSKKYNNSGKQRILAFLLVLIIVLVSKQGYGIWKSKDEHRLTPTQSKVMYSAPNYNGEDITTNMPGKPNFSNNDDWERGYEFYSEQDKLGRCGYAEALVGPETMPTEKRGSIGMVKPVGWHTVRYDNLISGKYLYNRCHLIAFELAGENANEKNLITGTRCMNVEGMLPFENKVASYVKRTKNHVKYRVTPIYNGEELLCRGVHIEARSIEDNEININVFCHNVQKGIDIDYLTGDSKVSE